jgi:hypothetical protein
MSSNNGSTWATVNSGLTNLYISALMANNGNLYAATNVGVFKSTNAGQNWVNSSSGITVAVIWCLGSGSSAIFAGTGSGGLFRSTDDGANWTVVNNGIIGVQIRGIGSNGNNLFCGVGGAGVYLSTDNGNNWNVINNGFNPSENVSSFIPYGSAEIVTTWGGVYYTLDNGANWTSATANLTNTSYAAFSSVLTGTDIYVGSGPGVWKRPISEIIIGINKISSEIPEAYNLNQNYPNPFNPTTNIKYQIPRAGYVTLKVFDILGKEIKTLVNEKQTPGVYEVTFDGSNLTSGIYFYKLTADDFSEVKKMTLIK